jgi:hypothetical protein
MEVVLQAFGHSQSGGLGLHRLHLQLHYRVDTGSQWVQTPRHGDPITKFTLVCSLPYEQTNVLSVS